MAISLFHFGRSNEANAASTDRVERERKRLEELFIWKMSEELKLSVDTEISFTEALRALNREKAAARLELNDALFSLNQVSGSLRGKESGLTRPAKSSVDAIRLYEKAMRRYGEIPVREVARLKPILGPEGLARYLVAKSRVTDKLLSISTSGNPLVD